MSVSFYDISVANYLQTLDATSRFLTKSREHFEKSGVELGELVEASLIEDMLPLRFQLVSVAHHSLGAIEAIEAGVFGPPTGAPGLDYPALEKLVAEARSKLASYSREAIDAMEENDLEFKLGNSSMQFVACDFVLSFSLPNFYFHASTAYDILRMKGAPIGKRDFLGMPRIKS